MAYLVLVRHGLSEYNKKGLWTGRRDPELTPEGLTDAKKVGQSLHDIHFDAAFSSNLKRHTHTLEILLEELGQNPTRTRDDALTERDYGKYTGQNKWEIEKKIGKDEFHLLRRSWNYPIPDGESLEDVSKRVCSFYTLNIVPLLLQNKNVLVSSSGNVLRSLVKFLENIPDEKITELEIAPGEAYVYTLEDGKITGKEIRNAKKNIY